MNRERLEGIIRNRIIAHEKIHNDRVRGREELVIQIAADIESDDILSRKNATVAPVQRIEEMPRDYGDLRNMDMKEDYRPTVGS